MDDNSLNHLPNNVVMYDHHHNPSVMVRIPKFRVCDVVDGGSEDVHPAFIVDGIEIPEILISKYPNTIVNDSACSLPHEVPSSGLTRNEIRRACSRKGPGWHQMTNAEWAAVALWSKKNNTMPRGNNSFSRDYYFPHETGVVGSTYINSKGVECVGKTVTATGPVTWSHDHTPSGIYDLNGNVWTQVAGLRLIDGVIQVTKNNDSALSQNEGLTEEDWWCLDEKGSYVRPGTTPVFKFDFANEKLTMTLAPNEPTDKWRDSTFETLQTDYQVPEVMKTLALFPGGHGYGEQKVWINNVGARYAWRGGTWDAFQYSGIFCLFMCYPEEHLSIWSGFRASYIDTNNIQ